MLVLYERIKSRREELGMTQEELAQKLGYKSRSSIQKIEKGENDIPQSKIKAFAVALNTTPEYLMGWTSSGNTAVGDDEEKLLNDYRTLDNGKKQTLFNMLAFLKSSQGTNAGNVVLNNKNGNNVYSNSGNVIVT